MAPFNRDLEAARLKNAIRAVKKVKKNREAAKQINGHSERGCDRSTALEKSNNIVHQNVTTTFKTEPKSEFDLLNIVKPVNDAALNQNGSLSKTSLRPTKFNVTSVSDPSFKETGKKFKKKQRMKGKNANKKCTEINLPVDKQMDVGEPYERHNNTNGHTAFNKKSKESKGDVKEYKDVTSHLLVNVEPKMTQASRSKMRRFCDFLKASPVENQPKVSDASKKKKIKDTISEQPHLCNSAQFTVVMDSVAKCPLTDEEANDQMYVDTELEVTSNPEDVLHKVNEVPSEVSSGFRITTIPDYLSVDDEDVKIAMEMEAEEERKRTEEALEKVLKTRSESHIKASRRAIFYDHNDAAIVHLKHPGTLYFTGQLQVEVLRGAVEVLGYTITSSSGSHDIHSLRGCCEVSFQTAPVEDKRLSPYALAKDDIIGLIEYGEENDSWLLLKKATSSLPLVLDRYIERCFHRQHTASADPLWKAGSTLNCMFSTSDKNKSFSKGEQWDDVACHIVNQLPGCSVLCGGKSVGKSTMLRFLVNRLLQSGQSGVVLLDFDPGQAELTPPGCVSLSVVRSPLLGPHFTHLKQPEKSMYVGDVNVTNCISRYMAGCASLIDFWQSQPHLKEMPCLVNTMGFSRGLGPFIMVQIITMVKPTTVLQIQSRKVARNYPELLLPEYVNRNHSQSMLNLGFKLLMDDTQTDSDLVSYDFLVVQSEAESKFQEDPSDLQGWGIESEALRVMTILSYLSKNIPQSCSFLDIVPYRCSMEALYLCTSHEPVPPHLILSAMNASLVALCSVDPQRHDMMKSSEPGFPQIITRLHDAEFHGFGIVRGIDMEKQQIYVTTPAPHKLCSVNCLVLGAVSLPSTVLVTHGRESGLVPYVVVDDISINKPVKRRFKKHRHAKRQ